MLTLHTLPLGAYQTNCYILHQEDSSSCVVIDPGYTPEVILDFLAGKGLKLEAILLTHGHFDHVGGVKTIAEATGCRVFLNERELTMPLYMTAGSLYYTDSYDEGDTVTVGSMTFHVMATPGHSPGSVCLICDDALFCGDTLFCGGCGRTDCPGGSWNQILQSLKRLGQIEHDYTVYPGHGASSSLRREQRGNHFMLEAMRK